MPDSGRRKKYFALDKFHEQAIWGLERVRNRTGGASFWLARVRRSSWLRRLSASRALGVGFATIRQLRPSSLPLLRARRNARFPLKEGHPIAIHFAPLC
jgi:hypothetical protein